MIKLGTPVILDRYIIVDYSIGAELSTSGFHAEYRDDKYLYFLKNESIEKRLEKIKNRG